MALTVSSTLAAELNCLQINTYYATVTFSEGMNDIPELCDNTIYITDKKHTFISFGYYRPWLLNNTQEAENTVRSM